MTQEEKELLFKDLCGRLPYGLKFDAGTVNPIHILQTIYTDAETHVVEFMDEIGFSFEFDDIKPYLRPMSSMTEDERKEYELLANHCIVTSIGFIHLEATSLIDWLDKKMFDYHSLIPMSLALEAPEGMYKTN